MYVCMYVCMNLCMYVCMYVCMYLCMYEKKTSQTDFRLKSFGTFRSIQTLHTSQGDFRLMSFTAGRCGTPLILNDQFRSLRRNGVRSSDLILCVTPFFVPSKSKADRDEPRSAAERSEAAVVGPKGCYEPNRTGRSVLF